MQVSTLPLTGTLAAAVLAVPASAQLSQDDCANAGLDVVGPGIHTYDTSAATTGTEGQNEPLCLFFTMTGIHNDIWFTYQATADGFADITTCAGGGTHNNTKVAAYPGALSCPPTGTAIACNDNDCGLFSNLFFPVQNGQTYIIQVGGFPGANPPAQGTGTIEISEIVPTPPQLVAHYKLDETSGTTCFDSSGNGNDGTFVGGLTLGQPGADPATNTSVEFLGVDGRVEIPSSPTLDALLNDFTVLSWANFNAIAGLMRLFGNQRPAGPGTGGSWSYGVYPGNMRFTTLDVQDFDHPASVMAGVWHHIAVVFDISDDATFYLDGVNLGTIAGGQRANFPAPGYLIGALDLVLLHEWMDGRIDDVQVYAGSLSDSEIQNLFDNPGETMGSGPIGTSYCSPAIPNTTGQPGVIGAEGSTAIPNNDVTLTASMLPAGQFGYFLNSQTQGFFNPPGSSGFICLGGSIGRFNQPGNIGQGPSFSIQLDLTAIPQPTGNVAVQPGETWNFQCWYRDIANTNNFTDGINIQFL